MTIAAAAWWGFIVPLAGCAVVVASEMLVLFYIWRNIAERDYLPAGQGRWSFCARVRFSLGDGCGDYRSALKAVTSFVSDVVFILACWFLESLHPPLISILAMLFAFPAFRIWSVHIRRSEFRLRARRILFEMGVPLCVRCGYDLRGSTGDICPECGQGPYPGLLKPSKSLIKT